MRKERGTGGLRGDAPLFLFATSSSMITEDRVRKIVDDILVEGNQFLVDLKVNPGNIVVVEVDNDDAIKVSELAELNKMIREQLGAEGEDVELRVSSPGTNKPFKVQRQYTKHVGRLVQVEMNDGKKLIGVMESWNEKELGLRIQTPSKVKGRLPKLDKEITVISCDSIKTTKATVTFK